LLEIKKYGADISANNMKFDEASHALMHMVHAYAHPCMHSLNFNNYQLSTHC